MEQELEMEAIKTAQIINIDSKQILNQIGYYDDYEPSQKIKSIVDDYIENYHNLVESTYSYTFRNIESVEDDYVYLGESVVLTVQLDNLVSVAIVIANRLNQVGEERLVQIRAVYGGRDARSDRNKVVIGIVVQPQSV